MFSLQLTVEVGLGDFQRLPSNPYNSMTVADLKITGKGWQQVAGSNGSLSSISCNWQRPQVAYSPEDIHPTALSVHSLVHKLTLPLWQGGWAFVGRERLTQNVWNVLRLFWWVQKTKAIICW